MNDLESLQYNIDMQYFHHHGKYLENVTEKKCFPFKLFMNNKLVNKHAHEKIFARRQSHKVFFQSIQVCTILDITIFPQGSE